MPGLWGALRVAGSWGVGSRVAGPPRRGARTGGSRAAGSLRCACRIAGLRVVGPGAWVARSPGRALRVAGGWGAEACSPGCGVKGSRVARPPGCESIGLLGRWGAGTRRAMGRQVAVLAEPRPPSCSPCPHRLLFRRAVSQRIALLSLVRCSRSAGCRVPRLLWLFGRWLDAFRMIRRLSNC